MLHTIRLVIFFAVSGFITSAAAQSLFDRLKDIRNAVKEKANTVVTIPDSNTNSDSQQHGNQASCGSTALRSKFDMLGFVIGDAWCNDALLTLVVPGFAFKDFSAANPAIFGPQNAQVGYFFGEARKVTDSSGVNTAYVRAELNLGFAKNLSPDLQTLVFTYNVRKGVSKSPEVLVEKIKRIVCSPDQQALSDDGALVKALVDKYGIPSTKTSWKETAASQRSRHQDLVQAVEIKAKEDQRYRQIFQPELVASINKVNASERTAAQFPHQTSAIKWTSADNTELTAAVMIDTCNSGNQKIELLLDGENLLRDTLVRANEALKSNPVTGVTPKL